MLKSLIKALMLVVGLGLSGLVSAVGMGGISLTSALGEPLQLEIELDTASKAETNNLSVRLATPEMFKSVGMEYPYGLPQLKFNIETHPLNGQPYLKITSSQPINEPFVSLLVELNWPSGKLLREYTFLLDPPGYAADQPKAAEVRPVEPIAIEEHETAPQVEEVTSMPIVDSDASPMGEVSPVEEGAPIDKKTPIEEAPVAAIPDVEDEPSENTSAIGNIATGVIRVKRGDTLYEIANQAKSSDMSLERMLVALYRANADVFDGNNMNRIKAGKILRMPEQSEIDELTQAQAVKEIRAHVSDWHAYRQRLSVASGVVSKQVQKQETSGKISTTVADKVPPAKGSAREVVKLSKGEAPGDKAAVGGGVKGALDKIHSQEEESIAKSKALADSKDRAALLEKNVKAMQRLIELKNQPAAPDSNVKSDKLTVLPLSPASEVVVASAVQPAKPLIQNQVEAPQPSLIDELLDEPLYLVGGAAVLLGLGGLGYMLRRRSKSREPELATEEDSDIATGHISDPIVPSPETGDFTNSSVEQAAVPENTSSEDVDPISEADLFLNFGRDEQAEEILKDALIKNPANHKIHLKLLSVYLNRRDVTAFSAVAIQLKDSGDAEAWEQAAMMGLKLEPNNPMYGGDAGLAAEVISEESDAAATPDAKFDLGKKASNKSIAMDFDLGLAAEKTSDVPAEPSVDSTVVMNAPMDFDVTGSRPSLPEQSEDTAASSMNLDDLIFDVTAGHKPVPEMPKEKSVENVISPDADMGLAFTLDIPGAEKVTPVPEQATSNVAMDIGLSEISLNLNEPAAATSAESDGKDDHWNDVATKLDLANAYKEMGDVAGAREILDEVVRDGDEQQRAAAEALIQQL